MARPARVDRARGEQLAPVGLALMDDARREAAAVLGEAAVAADKIVADAVAVVDTAIEEARADGRAAAEREAALKAARARRAIRSRTLAAQRAAYDDLRSAVAAAVAALRTAPDYDDLLDRWTALARAELGPDATVLRDPSPDGGVIATLGGKRVTYTLTALAEREMARLGDRIGSLWN